MGVLLMLMTIGGIVAAAFLSAISLATKTVWLRNFVLGGTAVWVAIYALMLFGFSLVSSEKTLSLNEPKAYCGFYFDCHMHTAVSGVRKARTIGEKRANGEFYVVKVKVFSDARRESLALTTVDAHVFDDLSRRYDRDTDAESHLPPQPDFEMLISPAESFEKEIVFDLPTGVRSPRLDLREGYGIDHVIEAVLIDDEDSIFHKRSTFKLQEQSESAGVK